MISGQLPHPAALRLRRPMLRQPHRKLGSLLTGSALAALCLLSTPLLAATAPGDPAPESGPHLVVPTTAQTLDAALARLARNPRDIDALVAAGRAALALGDSDAAIGFFSRADKLAPATPQVLAGLAVAKVRARDPLAALPLFEQADAAGALTPGDSVDRGLAYDLVSDNRSAQRTYKRAIAAGAGAAAGDEAVRRLVLSYAIAGDAAQSEAAIGPLLDRQDRAAVRTHAFALAILGREDEAVAMVQASMPPELAAAIAPYLRYMRKLTPAQQAAAANLGEFPHSADIGQDDPRIAQYAADHQLHRGPVVAVAQAAPVPTHGKSRTHAKPHAEEVALANPSPPEPAPSRVVSPGMAAPDDAQAAPALPDTSSPPPPVLTPAPQPPAPVYGPVADDGRAPYAPAAQSAPAPALPFIPSTEPAPAPASAPALPFIPSPSTEPAHAYAAPAQPAPPPPAAAQPSTAQPSTAPIRHTNFAQAFAALGEDAPAFEPSPGAVDIRKIAPTRVPVKPVVKAPPPPPAHPSRIWVELGVGRDTDRLAFDWHKLARDEPELFAHRKPFVTGWVRTNRLLTGPFDTEESANAFVEKLKKAGHEGVFLWTSPAGQVVDPL